MADHLQEIRLKATINEVMALAAIINERRAQDSKWGQQRNLGSVEWLCILIEEVGEAAESLNSGSPVPDLYDELTQVAAVTVAWMESLLRRRYGDGGMAGMATEDAVGRSAPQRKA